VFHFFIPPSVKRDHPLSFDLSCFGKGPGVMLFRFSTEQDYYCFLTKTLSRVPNLQFGRVRLPFPSPELTVWQSPFAVPECRTYSLAESVCRSGVPNLQFGRVSVPFPSAELTVWQSPFAVPESRTYSLAESVCRSRVPNLQFGRVSGAANILLKALYAFSARFSFPLSKIFYSLHFMKQWKPSMG
jgi:hypothetical protein